MLDKLDWSKGDGLLPAIVQDGSSGTILMLGYMNRVAYETTLETRKVTFYSRSRQRLWTKGESSGNFLNLQSVSVDCDFDTILVKAIPEGPVCHTGNPTCFEGNETNDFTPLSHLESTVKDRRQNPDNSSYTAQLFRQGRDKIAQKVGEEAVEVVIASKNTADDPFLEECADLTYHLTVLLADRGLGWQDVYGVLDRRRK